MFLMGLFWFVWNSLFAISLSVDDWLTKPLSFCFSILFVLALGIDSHQMYSSRMASLFFHTFTIRSWCVWLSLFLSRTKLKATLPLLCQYCDVFSLFLFLSLISSVWGNLLLTHCHSGQCYVALSLSCFVLLKPAFISLVSLVNSRHSKSASVLSNLSLLAWAKSGILLPCCLSSLSEWKETLWPDFQLSFTLVHICSVCISVSIFSVTLSSSLSRQASLPDLICCLCSWWLLILVVNLTWCRFT